MITIFFFIKNNLDIIYYRFTIEHLGERNEKEDDFVKYLNNRESRYVIVDHEYIAYKAFHHSSYLQKDQYTPNGRQISKIYVISWYFCLCCCWSI